MTDFHFREIFAAAYTAIKTATITSHIHIVLITLQYICVTKNPKNIEYALHLLVVGKKYWLSAFGLQEWIFN